MYLKHNNNFVHQLHFSKASGEAKTGNKTEILFLLLTTKNFDLHKNNLKETLKKYIWTFVASRFWHIMGKTDKWELTVYNVKSACFCCNRYTCKAFWEPNEGNLFLCGWSWIDSQVSLDKKVARTESLSVCKISPYKELRKKPCI